MEKRERERERERRSGRKFIHTTRERERERMNKWMEMRWYRMAVQLRDTRTRICVYFRAKTKLFPPFVCVADDSSHLVYIDMRLLLLVLRSQSYMYMASVGGIVVVVGVAAAAATAATAAAAGGGSWERRCCTWTEMITMEAHRHP